ncbi:MAG: ABC transporter permease [Planctomycetes bacterium]|nr:ABC transporter permease [Planctomycetota bacterium]
MKALIVARHEFSTSVKRWSFLLVTFGLPLFLLGVMGTSLLLQKESMEEASARISQAKLGFVDEAGLLTEPPRDTWVRYSSREEAKSRMRKDHVQIVAVVPADYLSDGRVDVYSTIAPSLFTLNESLVHPEFRDYLLSCILREEDPRRLARAKEPVAATVPVYLAERDGVSREERPEDYLQRMISGVTFFFLLFISISVSGGYLIQGMADEKENRVMEMVISSVTPEQLMTGKLIGLGAVGLLQVAIWSLMGTGTALGLAMSFAINPPLFLFCAIFYLLGYLLYGGLLLGIGSLGSNQRESTQFTWFISVTVMSPVFLWVSILSSPQSTLARVLTYIPLTTPTTMMLRYSVDPIGTPWWEIVLSIALLIASTVLAIRAAAKLYRVGLLLYGKRPALKEVWRWLWA